MGREDEINSLLATPSSRIKLTNEQINIDMPLKTNSKPIMYKINFTFNLFILIYKKRLSTFLSPSGVEQTRTLSFNIILNSPNAIIP